ncbi:MAG: helicase-associated domain-containing protein [Firmicutes bacterium]|nr:helicase-associated domain-containing protein [Bacillota bacterium]
MDNLRQSLESMTHQGSSGTLSELLRILKLKPAGTKKAEAVKILLDFYSNPDAAAGLFEQLNEYEKSLLTCIVQSKYRPLEEDLAAIAEKYNFQGKTNYYSYYGRGYLARYCPPESKLYAFFVNGEIPPVFQTYLARVIPPYVRTFHPYEVENIDVYAAIIDRESRFKDFDLLLSFINNNKVAATKAGGYMNKTALLKFQKLAGYDDICNSETGKIEDIRNVGETTVSLALVQLLRCGDVIDIVKDKFVLSQNASLFAGLTMPEKAKFLFEAYLRHGNRIIDECARISAAKLKFSKTVYNLSGPRREIVSYLRECPVNEWLEFNDFSKELYKSNRQLFAVTGGALIRDDYYNAYYNNASWADCEHCAISIVLMEYLATLGAVDVLAEKTSHSDYVDSYYGSFETVYFRITDLGAYLFGVTDSYQEKQPGSVSAAEKGFIVQPNFDVVVPNGTTRMQHELFFDRFAEKTVSDQEVSVYKLDFKAMVKALHIGLLIREINSYCAAFSSVPLPDNVQAAFAEWEAQSGRIRIRTVTVVEADDLFLLEEIKNYKGMQALSEGGLATVLVLTPGAEKKAKSVIEKNNRFCVWGS